jgi:hypothetical protein
VRLLGREAMCIDQNQMNFGACFQSFLISNSASVYCCRYVPISLTDVGLFSASTDVILLTRYVFSFTRSISSNKSCMVTSALGTEHKSKR